MIQIWYTDPSCHVLPLYRVSSSSSHPFYRLPGPYLPFAGLFRRGPRDPSTSIASAAVLGEKDRKGPGKTVREGEAYRRSARRRRKLFGVVVHDRRGRDTELPPSPFLRWSVPSMGKRPGKTPRRLRPMRPAVLGEKDRKGPGKRVREGEAYRRSARIGLKLGGVLVHDMRGRDTELPPSPFLRLPVPSMGKRPRGNHRGKGG